MRVFHKNVCLICLCEFKAHKKRACCSTACDKVRQRRRRNGDLSVMTGTMRHIERAAEQGMKHDKACQSWLHQRIAEWYAERFNERLAQNCRPPVPLAVVLACHDKGEMAYVPGSVTRAVAVIEDSPGSWADDQESDDDE